MNARILILIKGLGRGGAEQLLVNAAPFLDGSRFHYTVAYVLPDKKEFVHTLEEFGLDVTCLGRRKGGWIPALRALVRDERIDLVHAHLPYTGIGARVAQLGLRTKLVYTEHNDWSSYRRATYLANALTFWRNDHVFAVSEAARTSIRYPAALAALPMPSVETLHHGVDINTFHTQGTGDGIREELRLPPTAPLVVTVANFRREKGHDNLLSAAAIVRQEMPDVRFLLVGQGPLEADVRRNVARMSLESTVVITGPRQDVHRVISASDVFVLPSHYEGLPIALIEAMALGLPSVVTRVGGTTEVVRNRREAIVVAPKDPGGLAAAIMDVLRDRSLFERLGSEARKRAQHFDIKASVHTVESVYDRLLA